ncbi:hypothetical protein [Eremococcus coleocola]|uniref:Uncharacterized protein n=1 Tax=Eremococcus coleocola ACS-139-V-Col8 TaxID=908337 RepID=E4KN14_9LACT|nr:hypothetical protein [Eremococcus coleocola]EFR31800.1 hypothetical protein HMPREF9257_0227 [Eremococcus coleocola ACS-139-V-Col8]
MSKKTHIIILTSFLFLFISVPALSAQESASSGANIENNVKNKDESNRNAESDQSDKTHMNEEERGSFEESFGKPSESGSTPPQPEPPKNYDEKNDDVTEGDETSGSNENPATDESQSASQEKESQSQESKPSPKSTNQDESSSNSDETKNKTNSDSSAIQTAPTLEVSLASLSKEDKELTRISQKLTHSLQKGIAPCLKPLAFFKLIAQRPQILFNAITDVQGAGNITMRQTLLQAKRYESQLGHPLNPAIILTYVYCLITEW